MPLQLQKRGKLEMSTALAQVGFLQTGSSRCDMTHSGRISSGGWRQSTQLAVKMLQLVFVRHHWRLCSVAWTPCVSCIEFHAKRLALVLHLCWR